MKHILLVLMLFIGVSIYADDNKGFKCENNTYSSTGRQDSNSTPQATPYSWTDSKGKKK